MKEIWEHLSQVPEDVRATMTKAFILWEKQDLGVESMLDLAIGSTYVTQQTCRALQASANRVRLPELCRRLKIAHPDLSMRDVFRAAALFSGLYTRSVQRLYYLERKDQ